MAASLPSPQEIRSLPPDGGPGFNRLIHEKSPYLLQHARNPVDWHPWGTEAFEKARRDDKPVFLSVGYSTCHWCHVMERECFERRDVADTLNAHFVSIKVDREERPDLDDIYMTVTQALTGNGGWPNSVWLTPDGKPWFAGTYFPREQFIPLLLQLNEVWRMRRADVERQAEGLARSLAQYMAAPAAGESGVPDRGIMDALIAELEASFDPVHGGFGARPKFPPHGSLDALLYEARRSQRARALEMASATLAAIARGGIRDHVGGGFHRYATDAVWFLPHFEKMLYDNAQLAAAYAQAWDLTGDASFRDAARDALDWMLREMRHPEGGFFSALDADSDGEEGKFYLWSRREILDTLGPDPGEAFCRVYGVEAEGNYREEATGRRSDANILYLKEAPDPAAADALRTARRVLLERRNRRIPPHRDDKILAGWNGLAIGALSTGGRLLGEPRFTEAAAQAADFALSAMRVNGRLRRSWRDGAGALDAFLEDYAFLAAGLLDLHAAAGDERRLREARALTDAMLERYWDGETGGFFFTASDHERLLVRAKDAVDKAVPSGNGAALNVLVRLAAATGDTAYRARAWETARAFLPVMQRMPRACESLVLGATRLLDADPEGAAVASARPASRACDTRQCRGGVCEPPPSSK